MPIPRPGSGHDDRDATLDQDPQRRRQLGVERAGTDQLHDGARGGRDVADGPPTPRGRGVGHGRDSEIEPVGSERPAYGRPVGASNGPAERREPVTTWHQRPAYHRPAMTTRIEPLTPDRIPDLADAVRPGRRPELVLVSSFRVRDRDFTNSTARRTGRCWPGPSTTAPRTTGRRAWSRTTGRRPSAG